VGRVLPHLKVQRGLLAKVALVGERATVCGPLRVRRSARRLPAGNEPGGGVAQSETAQRCPSRRAWLSSAGVTPIGECNGARAI
jgi:hypothetical protein